MQIRDANVTDATATGGGPEQEIRILRERLAFYEGFDQLIQENVAHARELFRLAAQEKESAAAEADRVGRDDRQRQAELRAELTAIASEVGLLATAVEGLSGRIARALGELPNADGGLDPVEPGGSFAVAVVAHGVPSPRAALSLQRFVASLPQVEGVTAREFAGGVLRLDARAHATLRSDQFRGWEPARRIEALTERSDVLEFALGDDSG